MTLRLFSLATLLTLLGPPARADVELGMDMGFAHTSYDRIGSISVNGSLSRFEIPIPELRIGLALSEVVSLEPRLALQVLSGDDETFSVLALSGALQVHFSSDPTTTRAYIGAGPSLIRYSADDESASQLGFFGEGGVKVPAGESFLVRVGGGFERQFEKEEDFLPSANVLYLKVGFSAIARTPER
ncbi:MAG TPA: hypothetical protein VKU85_01080 [bacterium]|nr:hypothetical protein [bacterium]